MTALKRLFWTFLANTPLLIGCNFLAMSAIMYLDFLKRIIEKNDVEMTSALALRLFPSNIHWILAVTFNMAIAYGLAISTAVQDLSDPAARKTHIRRWMVFSLIAAPLYFLHCNFILPEANFQSKRLRHLIIHEGDSTRVSTRRSDRELGIGPMQDSIASSRAKLEALSQRDISPKRKERIAGLVNAWIGRLQWEIAKKIQMTLFIPITAIFALAAGTLLQHLRKAYWRLTLAGLLAKTWFTLTWKGMVQLEKRLDADGFSQLLAWTPIAGLFLAALALSVGLLRTVPSRPPVDS